MGQPFSGPPEAEDLRPYPLTGTINDLKFAEASVDGRMLGEMANPNPNPHPHPHPHPTPTPTLTLTILVAR